MAGDLSISCRLLLTVLRLVSLFHGRTVCGSPFTRYAPPARPSQSGRKGLGQVARSWLPGRPHGVSRHRAGAQRLSERVSPCTLPDLTLESGTEERLVPVLGLVFPVVETLVQKDWENWMVASELGPVESL
ncbi:hypothetical protein NDU88_003926 [Pleurodeles waltl]|uniref:Uncharacterized protein n=1 Tax=Pleurodeles waltl TaxID=8319 RepID=A0AAV7T7S2_PLEWA|nr:hypothetical protein NDU88_003926 [Pleurodeles waltl]